MRNIALFPGSFDPFTIGHENIVLSAIDLFDEIIIGIGTNTTKVYFYPINQRMEWIEELFAEHTKIKVVQFSGLSVDFSKKINANYILRGIRTAADFEYERAIAQVNKNMSGIESVFLLTTPEHTPVASSIVKDIIKHGGDAEKFIPAKIRAKISNYKL
eukprot:GHVL01028366.1.p2 GENE.GHVL01028366.1~~GHVL01028366.1.p2  ORF type:complete len:159 (-),score=20.91 GHVL01028366.1:917-1393(-)